MRRDEMLSFVDEVKQFEGVNANAKVAFVNGHEEQHLVTKNAIVYIDEKTFDHLPDDVQKILVIYALLFLSGDGLPKFKDDVKATEQWAYSLCQAFELPFYTEKDLNVQVMLARRMCYGNKESTYYKAGLILIKPPSIKKYTITNVGDITPDNKRSISIQSNDETLILDEEVLIREYAILEQNCRLSHSNK